jgi:hypothetical protein
MRGRRQGRCSLEKPGIAATWSKVPLGDHRRGVMEVGATNAVAFVLRRIKTTFAGPFAGSTAWDTSQVASGVGSALEMLSHENVAGSNAFEGIVSRLDAIDASLLLLREER